MITRTHKFESMTENMRPQDETMDGKALTFETLEHGGEFPDLMPQAIKMTDQNGNVFYELAIRHVTQKPYIAIIQTGQEILFDVKQVRTIEYGLDIDSDTNCTKEIINQINSIHEGPARVDSPISQALALKLVRSIYESIDIKMNIQARFDLYERQATVGKEPVHALHIVISHEHTKSVHIHKAAIQPHDALHVHRHAALASTSVFQGTAYELKFPRESETTSDTLGKSMSAMIEYTSAVPGDDGKRVTVYSAQQKPLERGDRARTFLPLSKPVDRESIKKPDKYGTVGCGIVCLEYSLTPSEKLENVFPVE